MIENEPIRRVIGARVGSPTKCHSKRLAPPLAIIATVVVAGGVVLGCSAGQTETQQYRAATGKVCKRLAGEVTNGLAGVVKSNDRLRGLQGFSELRQYAEKDLLPAYARLRRAANRFYISLRAVEIPSNAKAVTRRYFRSLASFTEVIEELEPLTRDLAGYLRDAEALEASPSPSIEQFYEIQDEIEATAREAERLGEKLGRTNKRTVRLVRSYRGFNPACLWKTPPGWDRLSR